MQVPACSNEKCLQKKFVGTNIGLLEDQIILWWTVASREDEQNYSVAWKILLQLTLSTVGSKKAIKVILKFIEIINTCKNSNPYLKKSMKYKDLKISR